MLQTLHIANYVLIERLDIAFHSGFSVITGETGAGKSILLGALGLLLGERADARAIRADAERCVVEAAFAPIGANVAQFLKENDLDDGSNELTVRRQVARNGKSRAFVNDTPVSVAQLRQLGAMLLDIHSQHQNLLVGGSAFQLGVLDTLADNRALLARYNEAFARYGELTAHLQQTRAEMDHRRQDEDYLRFQADALNDAALTAGEQEELEAEARVLQHTEEIKNTLYSVTARLNGEEGSLVAGLKECVQQLGSLAAYSAPMADVAQRLDSAFIDVKEVAADVERMQDDIDDNPARLDEVNNRLNTIYTLQQKHHVATVDELLALQRKFNDELAQIDHSDETLQRLEAEAGEALKAVNALGEQLSKRRAAAARRLEAEMTRSLVPLGLPNVRFVVQLEPLKAPAPSGTDHVTFLFSANRSTPPADIAQIASGGEVARVMLALKALVASRTACPTILFDEIDTGVSGAIAQQMARMMGQMSHTVQVISITHLPQIAAMGDYQYLVYKEDDGDATHTHIVQLNQEERVNEVARMLSGTNLTQAAINNAKDLLAHSHTIDS